MKVITLNKIKFSEKCEELTSNLKIQPDIVVGILNGGGYVINEIKNKQHFKTSCIELVKLQKKNKIKNNFFVKIILKILPYSILDLLRVFESNKARKSIDTLNLTQIPNNIISFDLNSISKNSIKNILIIDDAIDTGKTLFTVKRNLNNFFKDVQIKTAVISWTIETSIVKPDYYIYKNVLVRFPWSKDYKGKSFEE